MTKQEHLDDGRWEPSPGQMQRLTGQTPKEWHLEQLARAKVARAAAIVADRQTSAAMKEAIGRARAGGLSLGEIAKAVGCSRAYIAEICRVSLADG